MVYAELNLPGYLFGKEFNTSPNTYFRVKNGECVDSARYCRIVSESVNLEESNGNFELWSLKPIRVDSGLERRITKYE